tara:strand:- start:19505 stop:19822 length:318 start_codon:yes stop_codon:yes gene_type:complete
MKIILTTFVLFFSSSVFAVDMLGGKKIFCVEKRAENIVLLAFRFNNGFDVTIFQETNNHPLEINTHIYNTSTSEIHIKHYVQGRKLYIISRKNLSVNTTEWTSLL